MLVSRGRYGFVSGSSMLKEEYRMFGKLNGSLRIASVSMSILIGARV